MMTEREYMLRLADDARETADLLSPRRKRERERRVCAAFLHCFGVDFSPHELTVPETDPPDVIFRDAKLEVTIMLDAGRKIDADRKARAKQRDAAKTPEELLEPYHPTAPMALTEVVDRITAELAQTAAHYGSKVRLGLSTSDRGIPIRNLAWNLRQDVELPTGLRLQDSHPTAKFSSRRSRRELHARPRPEHKM